MSNNKQKMKLYTTDQVIDIFEKYGNMSAINARNIIDLSESIELPSDEEIEEKLNVAYGNGYEQGEMDFYKKMKSQGKLYADGYEGGYKRALDYMTDTIKNKIEVMENANNEFKKGTANTTHTTFLCTEFVSDASKGATLPRCIRCGKTQRIHPIITKNNEQQ